MSVSNKDLFADYINSSNVVVEAHLPKITSCQSHKNNLLMIYLTFHIYCIYIYM